MQTDTKTAPRTWSHAKLKELVQPYFQQLIESPCSCYIVFQLHQRKYFKHVLYNWNFNFVSIYNATGAYYGREFNSCPYPCPCPCPRWKGPELIPKRQAWLQNNAAYWNHNFLSFDNSFYFHIMVPLWLILGSTSSSCNEWCRWNYLCLYIVPAGIVFISVVTSFLWRHDDVIDIGWV